MALTVCAEPPWFTFFFILTLQGVPKNERNLQINIINETIKRRNPYYGSF